MGNAKNSSEYALNDVSKKITLAIGIRRIVEVSRTLPDCSSWIIVTKHAILLFTHTSASFTIFGHCEFYGCLVVVVEQRETRASVFH